MKIGIVTVFKSLNCGSFLQAWALKEKLLYMGHDVHFVDYDNPWDTFAKRWAGMFKCCMRFRFKRAKNILDKTRDYKRLRKEFKVISESDNSMDMYIFGSDTIWNFEDKIFNDYAPFFTGMNIQKPCYAFSVSVGSTSLETFSQNKEVIKSISKFKRIAVRDDKSEDVIAGLYSKDNLVRTIDPTLLLKAEDYSKHFKTAKSASKKYLLLYYFGSMPYSTWEKIQRFARQRDLNIVFVGAHEKRYDKCVVSSPENFISAFSNADYVFTNTFHGCVFSVIFNKSFATDGIHKNKIKGFLEQFNLTDRVVKNPEDVEKIYNDVIDYSYVNGLINEERKKSINYLREIICNEECHG